MRESAHFDLRPSRWRRVTLQSDGSACRIAALDGVELIKLSSHKPLHIFSQSRAYLPIAMYTQEEFVFLNTYINVGWSCLSVYFFYGCKNETRRVGVVQSMDHVPFGATDLSEPDSVQMSIDLLSNSQQLVHDRVQLRKLYVQAGAGSSIGRAEGNTDSSARVDFAAVKESVRSPCHKRR